jgi:hypothetical protein
MSHPRTKADVLAALEANAQTIATLYATLPGDALAEGDPDHWGPAHHLVHLTLTSRAIAGGLRSGRLPPHPTARSRGYAELIAAASTSVGAAPRELLLERGRVATVPAEASRESLVDEYLRASAELRAATEAWAEEDLDRSAMPHPYIGMLTVREMLLFCVFHERHHARLVRARW